MTTVAERAMRHVEHLLIDAESDELLEGLLIGMSNGLERAGEIAYGTDTCPGERVLTDPAVCPLWALPHAALWVGGTVPARPAGLTDEEWETYARAAVVAPFGALRGSPRALRILVSGYITPGALIRIRTRIDDDPFVTQVIVSPDDCPDPDALLAAMNADDVVLAGGKVLLELSATPLINEGTRLINDATAVIDEAELGDVT